MKKSLLGLLLAFTIFSACKETETTSIDVTGTAVITGTVKADIEQSNSAFTSEILSGYAVTIYWDTNDLGVVSDGDGRVESITVETDENGVYTAEVPTTSQGVDFNVEFDDFTTTSFTFNEGTETITTTAVFDGDDFDVTAISGETKIQNYDFGSFPSSIDVPRLATIKGNVTADINDIDTPGDPEPAAGAVVRVTWNDGSDRVITVATDSNGDFSIDVPTGVSGEEFTISFDEYEVDNYSYNNGTDDITGATATYSSSGDFNTGTLGSGESHTRNYNYGAPDNVEDPS
ncbi:MAG: hypothetical protein Tsb0034_03000 [Ekhidna sp.]